MIQEIFKDKIAEQRLIAQEEAEKARKKAENLSVVLKKAEKDIEILLKDAPPSAFKIPKGAYCAIVIKCPDDECKGGFTKKYSVFTGYTECNIKAEDIYVQLEHIGDITLQFESLVNEVDFSDLFKDTARLYSKGYPGGSRLLYFVFNDYNAE